MSSSHKDEMESFFLSRPMIFLYGFTAALWFVVGLKWAGLLIP